MTFLTGGVLLLQECERLGVQGHNVRDELQQLTNQLPTLFETIVSKMTGEAMQQAIEYYQSFTEYAHGNQQTDSTLHTPHMLTTLLEVRAGKTAPPSATADSATVCNNNNQNDAPAVDWDMLDAPSATAPDSQPTTTAGGAPAITWDLGDITDTAAELPSNSEVDGAGVSWDIVDNTAAASDTATAPVEISWDVAAVNDAVGGDGTLPDAAASSAPDISWDIEVPVETATAGDASTATASGLDIDRGIDMTSSRAEQQDDVSMTDRDGAVEATQAAGSSSNHADATALWLEKDFEYRSQLLDDLQVRLWV